MWIDVMGPTWHLNAFRMPFPPVPLPACEVIRMYAILPMTLLLAAQLSGEATPASGPTMFQIDPGQQPTAGQIPTIVSGGSPVETPPSEPPAGLSLQTDSAPPARLQPADASVERESGLPVAAQPSQSSLPSADRETGWSPATAPASPQPQSPPAELPTAARRVLPPEMIAEALTIPPGGAIAGRPVTLLEVLSTTTDPRRHAEIAHAYWRLAEAVAEYHFAFVEHAAIARFEAREEDVAMLRTAQASAAAALESTELLVLEAQGGLADVALLTIFDPLPADLPHVGPYRTHFDELFARRTAPAHARRIDRTLPVRRRAIDARAAALHAAVDGLDAAGEAYREGRLPFSALLAAMGQLGRQRRAMIVSVCQYNHDIADYATAVVAPGTTIPTLVAMLIRPRGAGNQPAGNRSAGLTPAGPQPAFRSDVQPAMHMEPVPAPGTVRPPLRTGQPTLAPPRPESPAAQPTSAPRKLEAQAAPIQEPSPATAPQPSQTEPPAEIPSAEPPTSPRSPAEPLSDLPPPAARTAMRLSPDANLATTSAIYPALLDMDRAVRAKQLAVTLHWNRSLPDHATEPVNLADCLKMAAIGQRARAIAAFWHARQRAAEYQVFCQAVDLFEELSLAALDRRDDPAGAAAMLQVRAFKMAGEADRLDAEAELLAAEHELTETLGRPLAANWLLPTTAPHSGPYLLKLEAQPRELVATRPVQRLAKAIPSLAESLQQRAAAVVQADAVRAAVTADYRGGSRSMEEALAGIHQQTDQTLAFLETLTAYNKAIADYALAVLPANAPADIVAQTLVVEPDAESAEQSAGSTVQGAGSQQATKSQ